MAGIGGGADGHGIRLSLYCSSGATGHGCSHVYEAEHSIPTSHAHFMLQTLPVNNEMARANRAPFTAITAIRSQRLRANIVRNGQ